MIIITYPCRIDTMQGQDVRRRDVLIVGHTIVEALTSASVDPSDRRTVTVQVRDPNATDDHIGKAWPLNKTGLVLVLRRDLEAVAS